MPVCGTVSGPDTSVAERRAPVTVQDAGVPRQRRPQGAGVRKRDDYSHLQPLFAELAALSIGDPNRERLREGLIIECLPLAEHIAMRFSGRGQPQDDLIQVARLGLTRAVDRFEPARGKDFLSFAVPTIMGEVRRFFRDTGWAVRVPRGLQELRTKLGDGTRQLAQALGRAPTPTELAGHLDLDVETVHEGLLAGNCYETTSLDRPLGDGTTTVGDTLGGPDSRIELLEDFHSLAPLLKQLPDTERAMLKMRFFDGLTQSRIAARLGVSQMQVSRVLTKTLEGLREKLSA